MIVKLIILSNVDGAVTCKPYNLKSI